MKSIREKDNENNLEYLIDSNGYSKSQFADMIEISRQYLQKILFGKSKMKTDTMIKASELLNVEPEDLFSKKCLICNSNLQTIYYDVDRLGNSTNDRSTENDVHKIYDCQKCGYIQITDQFREDFDFIQLSTENEYKIIEDVINKIRLEQNIKWHETITLKMLSEPNYIEVRLLLTSETTSTILTIYYDENNREIDDDNIDEELDFEPKEYTYETTVVKDDITQNIHSGWEMYLFESPKSNKVIATGFYLGEGTGTQKDNVMRIYKNTMIPVNDKLTKSIPRKIDALNFFKYHIDGDYYILEEDGEFTSPSLAAAVILGKECSGTRLWRNKEGIDLFTLIKTETNNTTKKTVIYKSTANSKTLGDADNLNAIKEVLSANHNEYFAATEIPFMFTSNKEADIFVKDISNNPEAFFIACLMDRGIKAEAAWIIPLTLRKLIGSIKMNELDKLSYEELEKIFVDNSLHRYKTIMADVLFKAVKLVMNKYDGNPANIWEDTNDSNIVVKRLKEFKGVGEKISTMTVNILYRDFKIPFVDLKGIDISPDSQVLKVFKRLGLIKDDKNTYEVIYKAREMNPEFPGIYDVSTWEIGRNFCHSINPNCNDCPLNNYCGKNY